jgi:CubicO group peptidase (beta-lactamase class C family)
MSAFRLTRSAVLSALAFSCLGWSVATPLVARQTPRPAGRFIPAARPEVAGFSSERLARIDEMMNDAIAKGQIPGGVVFISRGGRVVLHKAYGTRDPESRAPMQRDAIFRIASQSKAITSLAVMMLWEEGRFQLDEPISRYLPDFAQATVLKTFNAADSSYTTERATRAVTIRHLLTHTSGIDYPAIGSNEFRAIYAKAGVPSGIGNDKHTIGEKMRVLGKLPLKHQPGERFTYSLGLDVLGYFVEVISGMPFDQFLRTRIFDPLGMKDTWFYLPEDRAGRLVVLHDGEGGKAVPVRKDVFDGANPNYPTLKGTYFSGGAGLSSTVEDYARFLQLFLNKGEFNGVRLLSPKTVELIMTEQTPKLDVEVGLAFGLETADNDHQAPRSLGSFTWGGAFATSYWADPEEQLIGQIYTNMLNPLARNLSGRFETLTYAALVNPGN